MINIDQHQWKLYVTYLNERTSVSEPQAEVLALRKTAHSTDEISEKLSLPVDTVEDHLDEILNQLDAAKEFCTIMQFHPSVDVETRQNSDIDDTPFNLLSSAVMHHPDTERSRLELELHHALTSAAGESFLLIEREVVETTDWATKTIEERSAHEQNALRGYIYNDAATLNEFYLRYALLAKAGIDPTAKCARSAEGVLDRDISEAEAERARELALDRATTHDLEGILRYRQ